MLTIVGLASKRLAEDKHSRLFSSRRRVGDEEKNRFMPSIPEGAASLPGADDHRGRADEAELVVRRRRFRRLLSRRRLKVDES